MVESFQRLQLRRRYFVHVFFYFGRNEAFLYMYSSEKYVLFRIMFESEWCQHFKVYFYNNFLDFFLAGGGGLCCCNMTVSKFPPLMYALLYYLGGSPFLSSQGYTYSYKTRCRLYRYRHAGTGTLHNRLCLNVKFLCNKVTFGNKMIFFNSYILYKITNVL